MTRKDRRGNRILFVKKENMKKKFHLIFHANIIAKLSLVESKSDQNCVSAAIGVETASAEICKHVLVKSSTNQMNFVMLMSVLISLLFHVLT